VRCPTLAELPPPPEGTTGWPWTVETPQSPQARSDGSPWPCVSIVTPSYNQGRFIEETIRSVLLQGYPNLEYIIIDGGSSDNSVEIIRKYERWLTYWTSERDRGQAHAINKGFEKSKGVIDAYLNSDDFYMPNALNYCVDSFSRLRWDLFIGTSEIRYFGSWKWIRRSWWLTEKRILPLPFLIGSTRYGVSQESTFWTHKNFANKRFDETLHFCLDVDWYCQIARGAKIALSSHRIGYFRRHPESKTSKLKDLANTEIALISAREEIKGIDRIGNLSVWKSYRNWFPILAAVKLLSGAAEFVYVHPQ